MNNELKVIRQIAERYGPVINLEKNPEVLIEIMRKFSIPFIEIINEIEPGTPDAGPSKPAPSLQLNVGKVTNEDLMKAILKLSKQVAALKPTRRK
jgi:hypothetical protein